MGMFGNNGGKKPQATPKNFKKEHSDEALDSAKRALVRIKNLISTINDSYLQIVTLPREDQPSFYHDINANVEILNRYLLQIKKLALALVNGRYSGTEEGDDLNLNVLSVLNRIPKLSKLPNNSFKNDLEKLESEIKKIIL